MLEVWFIFELISENRLKWVPDPVDKKFVVLRVILEDRGCWPKVIVVVGGEESEIWGSVLPIDEVDEKGGREGIEGE